MKKVLFIMLVAYFASNLIASAEESKIENFVSKKLTPITQKEKQINSQIETKKKANLKKQEELKKQQAARKAKAESRKKAIQTKRENTKNAIKAEKEAWKSLLNK